MRFHGNSLAPRIIELFNAGMSQAAIARELGCRTTNVHKTLKRHNAHKPVVFYSMKISALAYDEAKWLKEEAARVGVPWRDLARAMLVDAIEEARNGKD